MQFESTAETVGKALGFCAMFLVFSTILFLIVTMVWERPWLYVQAIAMTGAIVLTGDLLKRWLS